MNRRVFAAGALSSAALLAAPRKLPPFGGTVRALGHEWDVLDAADWVGSEDLLQLKVSRPQEANPRTPIQYALLKGAAPDSYTLELEMRPDAVNGKLGSAIIVYAWRDNLHFNYIHVSPDTGREQPVHNGIFHVYGGDRVRISNEEGPRVWTSPEWTRLRVAYDASKHTVETWVRGERNVSLHGIDLSLQAGRIGVGSFFNTVSIRSFRLEKAGAK
jgi:hypothetical protein